MGKSIDITLDEEVYEGLVEYGERELGSQKAKSLIINLAVKEFLQRKGILTDTSNKSKGNRDQGSLFK